MQTAIAFTSLFVSLVALVLAFIVGCYSMQVNRRQLEILGRRAQLKLRVDVETRKHDSLLRLFALNEGTGSARNFYWDLRIPEEFWPPGEGYVSPPSAGSKNGMILTREKVAGVRYRHCSGFFGEPVYPSRSVVVLTFATFFTGGSSIRWEFASEDGAFPPDQRPGVFEVELARPQQ